MKTRVDPIQRADHLAEQARQRVPAPDKLVVLEAELRRLLLGRPGISLKEICGALWPQLPWYAGRPSELAATNAPPGYSAAPEALVRMMMDRLVAAGEAVEIPRPDEVDELARHGWTRPGDVPQLESPPPSTSTDGRRQPRQQSGRKGVR